MMNFPHRQTPCLALEESESLPASPTMQSPKLSTLVAGHEDAHKHHAPQRIFDVPTTNSRVPFERQFSPNNESMRNVVGSPLGNKVLSTSRSAAHRARIDTVLHGFLYISGALSVLDEDRIRDVGISAFLACARDTPLPGYATEEAPGNYATLHLPMADAASTELEAHFGAAFKFLDAMHKAGRRVLVYCREGKSRSASIVIAYLIRTHGMGYEQALEHVRRSREEVDPNFSFCSQLERFSQSSELSDGHQIDLECIDEDADEDSGVTPSPGTTVGVERRRLELGAASGSFAEASEPAWLLSPDTVKRLAVGDNTARIPH